MNLETDDNRCPAVRPSNCVRVSHDSNHLIGEHRHDWPTLTIFLAGSAQETFDEGEIELDSPTVIFHPGGASHADRTGAAGLETAGIVFDPAWLRREGVDEALAKVSNLARWTSQCARTTPFPRLRAGMEQSEARQRTADFFREACSQQPRRKPLWLQEARKAVTRRRGSSVSELAREHGVHPDWLTKHYRGFTGEGVQESLRRLRVERLLQLIRNTQLPLSEVAASAGFCDQSHMNRCFAAVLQTRPTAFVRRGAVAAGSSRG